MSSALGSSLAAFFCATSMMLLPPSMAASSALMDFGRPTNSGITMCGKTTTSRSGSRGRTVRTDGNRFVDMRRPFRGYPTVAGAQSRTQGETTNRPCGQPKIHSSTQRCTLPQECLTRAGGDFRLVGKHQDRRPAADGVVINHDLGHVFHAGQV